MFRSLRVLLFSALLLVSSVSLADEQLGAFRILDDQNVIALTGRIDRNAPFDFRRAAQKRPNARTLILTSPGGLPGEALLVALEVRERALNTFVPRDGACRAECAYVFLAGVTRVADGAVTLTRFEPDGGDGLQIGQSELVDALNEFGTPQQIISMILTGTGQHTLTVAELGLLNPRLGEVDRKVERQPPIQVSPPKPAPSGPSPVIEVEAEVEVEVEVEVEEEPEVPVFQPVAPQSTLSIAVYEGLDFYGGDLSSGHVANIAECARGCLGDNMCRAFTFNADPKVKSGPNCFLKSGTGRLEAYRYAISGRVLRNGEQPAEAYTFGAIDPTNDVTQGLRYTGLDMTTGTGGINSLSECRQACIEEDRCAAFTYRTATRTCSLKSVAGSSRQSKGYVSGLKRYITIPLSDVIPIEE